MVALARATMSRPRLLLLDEPSLGLAPMIVARIMQQIAALRGEGGTVLIVEQNAHAALAIADRGYVLENGRIALEGRAAELLENPAVQEAYLGGQGGHYAIEARIRATGSARSSDAESPPPPAEGKGGASPSRIARKPSEEITMPARLAALSCGRRFSPPGRCATRLQDRRRRIADRRIRVRRHRRERRRPGLGESPRTARPEDRLRDAG